MRYPVGHFIPLEIQETCSCSFMVRDLVNLTHDSKCYFSFFFYVLLISKPQCLFYKITPTMLGELNKQMIGSVYLHMADESKF